MLDKEKLSKQKYIYSIYSSRDGTLHVEKHPVIYINSIYVYYKMNGRDDLERCRTNDVRDDVYSISNVNFTASYGWYARRYFWNVEDNLPETLQELKEKFEKDKFLKEKAKAKADLDYAERIYKKTLEQYKKYEE